MPLDFHLPEGKIDSEPPNTQIRKIMLNSKGGGKHKTEVL